MPLYWFRCDRCSETHEILMPKPKDSVRCPDCGERAKRAPTTANAQFRGPGFHATDYAPPDPKKL